MRPTDFDKMLKALSRRTPFRTFHVELVSGSKITVQHPEALAHHNGRGVFIAADGEISIIDAEEVSRLIDPPKDLSKRSRQA